MEGVTGIGGIQVSDHPIILIAPTNDVNRTLEPQNVDY